MGVKVRADPPDGFIEHRRRADLRDPAVPLPNFPDGDLEAEWLNGLPRQ